MATIGIGVDRIIGDVLRAEYEVGDAIQEEARHMAVEPSEVAEHDACGPLDDLPGGLPAPAPAPEEDGTRRANLVSVAQLDGVPLFYARGVPPRPQSFLVEPNFRDILVRTVQTVRARAPESFGGLVRITSAGAFVQKPGLHGQGRAFDHDAWTFERVDIRPIGRDHAAPSRARRQRYWALVALMRSHSAFVLHGLYNKAHEDHAHQDNGSSVPFSAGSEATVKLAQAICNDIFGQTPRLAVDGVFGPRSRAAVRQAMIKVELAGDVFDATQWRLFLLRSGRLGFELSMLP